MDSVKIFAPASVANVGCGYDTMGFAIGGLGDEITLTTRPDSQLVILPTIGAELPSNPKENVATIAINALLNELKSDMGFDIQIKKLFRPGSGLGSSASSAAGAVFAVNELLDKPFTREQLLPFALEGEAFASKSYHADNVAPSLLGGFQVIRSYNPLDIFHVPISSELFVLIIFPDVEIKTAESKKLLPKTIDVTTARKQWSNVGGLIQALHTQNYELLKNCITDYIAEPVRSPMIPEYNSVKKTVSEHNSVGFNISGSGPTMFSLFTDEEHMMAAENEVLEIYKSIQLDVLTHRTKINMEGCHVI